MTDPPYPDGRSGEVPDGPVPDPGGHPSHGQPPPHGATQPYPRPPGGFGQPVLPPQTWGRPQWGAAPPSAQQYGGAAPSYGGPGYGAPGHPGPPFGPPGPPPARRGPRWGLLAALAAVAVVVVAVLATTAGPTALSRTAVERDVAVQFEQREGVAVDLECAEEMPVERGARYECTGMTADDEQITLQLEITDEDGARYTWTEP